MPPLKFSPNRKKHTIKCFSSSERIKLIDALRTVGYVWHRGFPSEERMTGEEVEKVYPFFAYPILSIDNRKKGMAGAVISSSCISREDFQKLLKIRGVI